MEPEAIEYNDGYNEDDYLPRCQPRLFLCGGPYDGQVWPWALGMNEFPGWIVLGSGNMHEPQREYVYRQRSAAITANLFAGIIYYDYVEVSPGARIQRETVRNNEILRATINELREAHSEQLRRLRNQLARYRRKKKA